MRSLFISCLLFFQFPSIDAQLSSYCDFDDRYGNSVEQSMEMDLIIEQLSNLTVESRSIIEIPVVVHILYRQEVQNISDDQVSEQLQILNAGFSGEALLEATIPAEFYNSVASVNFKFCLAEKDPQGEMTSGITRKEVDIINIAGSPNLFYDDLGGVDAWDTDRYLNIWVAESDDLFIGKASFPGMGASEEQGIVMDVKYFGGPKSLNYNAKYTGGKSLIHEVGHYFGLKHLWGNNILDCTDEDGIDDTPVAGDTYLNSCLSIGTSCSSIDMPGNYMMYTSDDCLHYFTKGQRDRMRKVLLEYRSGLMNSGITCSSENLESEELSIRIIQTNVSGIRFEVIGVDELDYTEIQLFDTSGRLIWFGNGYQGQELYFLPMENRSPSIYFLVLSNGEELYSKRIIWM